MPLSHKDAQSFAQGIFDTFDLSGLHINQEIAIESLYQDTLNQWNELNSKNVMQRRHDYFKIPNVTYSDYAERILEMEDDKKVIYGIRHLNTDRTRPFIDLRSNFQISSKTMALDIYDQIKHHFTYFKPQLMAFWSAKKLIADFWGSIYWVTQASDIKKLTPWKDEKLLTLIQVVDDSYYQWYQERYEAFHTDWPKLKEFVTVNSKECMNRSMQQGLLYEVYYQGEKIGLIAGERSLFLGHPGIYFNEIFIDLSWKGKGLAKAIQRKFVVGNAQDDEWIWGTINDQNIPSCRTASANQRKAIRFESFIKIQHALK